MRARKQTCYSSCVPATPSQPLLPCEVRVLLSSGIPKPWGRAWHVQGAWKMSCEIRYFMARQEKFKHKISSLPSSLPSTVYLHWALTTPPHLQKYLLSHEEQLSPSFIKNVILKKITFLLHLARGHDDPTLCT